MRRMSFECASLWSALSTAARGPRSTKSTGVQTGNGFRARIRSRIRIFRSRAGPRCALVCPVFAYILRTISVQTMLTLFGQIRSRAEAPNAPTSRRLNRRLTAVFLQLRYRSGRPPYQEGTPHRQLAAAVAASPSVPAWLRPSLTASGDWWATTTNGLVQRAATARSYIERSCARLVSEPEIIDCRIAGLIRQNQCD